MIYGGATQLIIGLLEYIRGNGFAGAAFSSYGCFWMGWFINSILARQKITSGADETGEILWFILWGVLTFCFFLFTLRKPITLQIIFSTLTVTFMLLAAGVRSPKAHKAGGYFGFVCAASAIYAAMVELAEEELGLKLPGAQVWWPKRNPQTPNEGIDANEPQVPV
jgi:succinate-acetate transporter protein